MMDLTLFRDRTYSLAIGTIFTVLFAVYGMLLVITQYLQNVRGFSPTAGRACCSCPTAPPASLVSLRAGRLMGIVGSRRLILVGLVSQIAGLRDPDRRPGPRSTAIVVVGPRPLLARQRARA